MPKKKKTTKARWENEPKVVEEIIKRAEKAVDGYEKYLLDKMNYNELAKIMQELRGVLPTSDKDKKKNK
jgi:hypothetical protein